MIRRGESKARFFNYLIVFICLLLLFSCGTGADDAWPRRIILFIGDGMGPEQVVAGSYYLGRSASFTEFGVPATVTTHSADNPITDSAAAATAIATGHKVGNGVLSMDVSGAGAPFETILEKAKRAGMLTGLVTTTYLTHATPAAFAAHQPSRTLYDAIADDYLLRSRPNIMLGGGANGLDDAEALAAGYTVVKNKIELMAVSTSAAPMIAGLFGTGFLPYEIERDPASPYPDLAEMTTQALRMLEDSSTGFFLMVESGLIDQAAHVNNATRMVGEVAALDRAVSVALDWAEGKDDVLIIVTADHETGGITSVTSSVAGSVPAITWSTTGHTARAVDLYAWGTGSTRFSTATDNTHLFASFLE